MDLKNAALFVTSVASLLTATTELLREVKKSLPVQKTKKKEEKTLNPED